MLIHPSRKVRNPNLDKAIESYRRAHFFAGLNDDFAALRQNKTAWEEERKEREAWDATLPDGLQD
jgi:hypothetical protein